MSIEKVVREYIGACSPCSIDGIVHNAKEQGYTQLEAQNATAQMMAQDDVFVQDKSFYLSRGGK